MISLAICAVVRNEEAYLEEWIKFHQAQGVKWFFLYENQSTDGTVALIEKLVRATPKWEPSPTGIEVVDTSNKYIKIVHRSIDTNPCQFVAYNNCLEYIKILSARLHDPITHCAFLDCDEFLHSPRGLKLPDVLRNYENASAINVHWVFYGSNGHRTKTEGLVTDRFTKRSAKVDKHTKAIVKVSDAIEVGKNPHYFKVTGRTVDENGNILSPTFMGLKEGGTADILRINHYHTKSYEEYIERKKKPDPGTGVIYTRERLEEMFKCHDLNEVADFSATGWNK